LNPAWYHHLFIKPLYRNIQICNMKVLSDSVVLTESNEMISVESNGYERRRRDEGDTDVDVPSRGVSDFPPDSIKREYFIETKTHSTCTFKGEAFYYSIKVNGRILEDATWYYPKSKDTTIKITDHVAFYKSKVTFERDGWFIGLVNF